MSMAIVAIVVSVAYLAIILLICGINHGGALREQRQDREDEQP